MKEFNINDYVNIKLTETGIDILKTLDEFKNLEIDENGYTKMKLWEVMSAFGYYMCNGCPDIPFEMTIAISEEYLKDPKKGKGL